MCASSGFHGGEHIIHGFLGYCAVWFGDGGDTNVLEVRAEDGGSSVFRNVGIEPQHYMTQ